MIICACVCLAYILDFVDLADPSWSLAFGLNDLTFSCLLFIYMHVLVLTLVQVAGTRAQPLDELSFWVAPSRETTPWAIQWALALYPLGLVVALRNGSPTRPSDLIALWLYTKVFRLKPYEFV